MFELITVLFGALLVLAALLVVIAIWLNALPVEKNVFSEHRKRLRLIDPLFLKGNDLFYWAKDTAAQIVTKYLRAKTTAATPVELSKNLHADATRAMFPLQVEHDVDLDMIECPKEGQGMIGITAPEVLEIADHIQHHLTVAEQEQIRSLAQVNVRKLANVDHLGFDGSLTPCPLLGADGICSVYAARPLRCRPLHAATAWRRKGIERTANEESDYDEQIVEQGAEAGLTEALESAGRDGNVYELNSALLAALDTPNAAERWAKGEDVFSQCKRYK